MATTAFDLDPADGQEQFSNTLALAAGEVAYARFTSLNNVNEVAFEIDANSVTTLEQVEENAVIACTRVGPATIRLKVTFADDAEGNVTGILEGV